MTTIHTRAIALIICGTILIQYTLPLSLAWADIDETSTADQATTTQSEDTTEVSASTAEDGHVPPSDEDMTASSSTEESALESMNQTEVDGATTTPSTPTENATSSSETSFAATSTESTEDADLATTTSTTTARLFSDVATTTIDLLGESTSGTTTEATSSEPFVLGASGESASTTERSEGDGEDGGGSPTIVSGEAVAMANILNIVNTNLVNSDGYVYFSNLVNPFTGVLDFRPGGETASGGCALLLCSQDQNVNVHLQDSAYIDNAILLRALTGSNAISGGSTSTIDTGNAYAGLNLVNLANTNFVDSNYLLVTVNAFNGINGDIVFPGLSSFLSSIAQGSPASVAIHDEAEVINDVDASSGTGDNEIDGNGAITTGDALSSSNVFNQLNTSLIGGGSVSILLRVHGSWAGQVFGAPQDFAWTEGPDGNVYLFDLSTTTSPGTSGLTNVRATSSAFIHNDVQVVALTGDNEITGADSALITTGNALSAVNLVNIANGNIIGRNWLLAIINIFGDFNGNIAFGRPDLWIGAQAEAPASIKEGSIVTLKFSVINNGDAEASDAIVTGSMKGMAFLDSPFAHDMDGENPVWPVGVLPPGSATEITYRARVTETGAAQELPVVASVSEREPDNALEDNTDTLTLRTDPPGSAGGGGSPFFAPQPQHTGNALLALGATLMDLSVERVSSSTEILPGDTASERLIVRNSGAFESDPIILHDILRSPNGEVLRDEVWDLGTVLPHEEITVQYDITFNDGSAPGVYFLSTELKKQNGDTSPYEHNGVIIVGEAREPDSIDVASAPETAVTVERHTESRAIVPPPEEATSTPATTTAAVGNRVQFAAAAASGGSPFGYVAMVLGATAAGGALFWFLGAALTRRRSGELRLE